jgi:hypothetical protein
MPTSTSPPATGIAATRTPALGSPVAPRTVPLIEPLAGACASANGKIAASNIERDFTALIIRGIQATGKFVN